MLRFTVLLALGVGVIADTVQDVTVGSWDVCEDLLLRIVPYHLSRRRSM
jgi:hypothetical protein